MVALLVVPTGGRTGVVRQVVVMVAEIPRRSISTRRDHLCGRESRIFRWWVLGSVSIGLLG